MAEVVQILFAISFLFAAVGQVAAKGAVDVNVGVVLDTGTLFARMCLTSINMSVDEFYESHSNYTTRLALHVMDSKNTTVGAASAALELLWNVGVDAIIGTQSSSQAVFVSDLAAKAQVPLVSFSATSPSLSAHSPFFVRTTLNDSAQVAAISALVHSFSWREVALLYEDSEFGSGIIPFLTNALQDVGAQLTGRSPIRLSADAAEMNVELQKLVASRSRVFVVHMDRKLASMLFSQAAKMGMMGGDFVWIVSTGIAMELELMDSHVLRGGLMDGVLGVRPCLKVGKLFVEFTRRWKAKFRKEYPGGRSANPGIFQLWAYDTVRALAEAAEDVQKSGFPFPRQGRRNANRTADLLLDLGTSLAGQKLLDSILVTDIADGISGRFRLIDGQLDVVKFQLVSVVNGVPEPVGYWTPSSGRWRSSSNSTAKIEEILWSGKPPRGWEWPTKGKKLRIGVPFADGFFEFVRLGKDRNNKTVGSGFCIEVFEAAIEQLDYNVSYEYILYNDTYDNLVQQVYLNKFDAAVGDITIWSSRAEYVDFTTPFTESGVVMIVAIHDESLWLWSFLDPMTCQLWLATVAAFILTGFVVWLLEHRDNKAFRVTSSDDLGRVLYFSFSTIVFSHREDLKSNFSRLVMVVWLLVMLVLISSYTASLSSMLTSQQLQPSVIDATDLINRGEKVGYLYDSFIKSLLINLGFIEENLVCLKSPEEYAGALSKGSLNGGVPAIFDEIPYVRFFFSHYASNAKYTVAGRTYKTDGFGFIFPKGSPLVPDISRAILKVKEGNTTLSFEKKLYGDMANAPLSKIGDKEISSVTNRLSFRRFLGLFLITGIISFIALLSHLALFFCENRNEINRLVSQHQSIWGSSIHIARLLILGIEPQQERQ